MQAEKMNQDRITDMPNFFFSPLLCFQNSEKQNKKKEKKYRGDCIKYRWVPRCIVQSISTALQ